jgi:GNAT superfamily N-acetyltransferase
VPADLGDRLVAHGLSFSEDEPAMAVELGRVGEESPIPPGLTIQPVRDERDLAEWVDVWLFPVPVAHRQAAVDVLRGRGIGAEHPWCLYLGRLDGEPVATSERFAAGRSVSVQYVVTLPAFRRRGIGAAMTARVLQDGRARGHDLAVLTASPAGIGVYRRLGFRAHCRIRRYEWEPNRP